MSGKFMRTKKFAISTITVLLIASQLCGCAATSQSEMLDMINRQETIVIEIAEPISVEQGEEKPIEWLELASLTTYQDFRNLFDDTLGITPHGTNGKNGIVYVDLAGNHTNNSTLRYAFANQKFLDTFWNNSDNLTIINNSIKGVYVDVTTDKEARLASINAYFNIFADAEPNYFNGASTLSRAEFYSGVYRASNPVSEIASNPDFLAAVGAMENAEFASELNKQGVLYLDTNSQSLNASNFGGTITRAEAIYTLVKMYYGDEFATITGKESCYSDATNGGDIASKQKFIETNKETGTVDYKTYWKSYELSYALQNPDKGLPTDLYKALVVASNHNLINGTESRWDEGLVKSEALDLITRVYEDLGATINVSRGNSTGEVIENEQLEVETPEISEATPTPTQAPTEFVPTGLHPSNITLNEDGTVTYNDAFINELKTFRYFADANREQLEYFLREKTMFEFIFINGGYEYESEVREFVDLHAKKNSTLLEDYPEIAALGITGTDTSKPSNGNTGSSSNQQSGTGTDNTSGGNGGGKNETVTPAPVIPTQNPSGGNSGNTTTPSDPYIQVPEGSSGGLTNEGVYVPGQPSIEDLLKLEPINPGEGGLQ